jgi:hypothetical protein
VTTYPPDQPDQPDIPEDKVLNPVGLGDIDQPVADPEAVPKADEDRPVPGPDSAGGDDEEALGRPVDQADPDQA